MSLIVLSHGEASSKQTNKQTKNKKQKLNQRLARAKYPLLLAFPRLRTCTGTGNEKLCSWQYGPRSLIRHLCALWFWAFEVVHRNRKWNSMSMAIWSSLTQKDTYMVGDTELWDRGWELEIKHFSHVSLSPLAHRTFMCSVVLSFWGRAQEPEMKQYARAHLVPVSSGHLYDLCWWALRS